MHSRASRGSCGRGALRGRGRAAAISSSSKAINRPARDCSAYKASTVTASASNWRSSGWASSTWQWGGKPALAMAGASIKTLCMVTAPCMRMPWTSWAGTQQARCGGTNQLPCGVCTLMTPRAAYANCPRAWLWLGNIAPAT
ncbi:hypothetical protein D3C72_1431590 [compost metagenome]